MEAHPDQGAVTGAVGQAHRRRSPKAGGEPEMIPADFTNAQWRKSTRSGEAGACVEVAFAPAAWRKSTRSGDTTNCVEVAHADQAVGVRDSKHPTGPVLIFPAAPWTTFLRAH